MANEHRLRGAETETAAPEAPLTASPSRLSPATAAIDAQPLEATYIRRNGESLRVLAASETAAVVWHNGEVLEIGHGPRGADIPATQLGQADTEQAATRLATSRLGTAAVGKPNELFPNQEDLGAVLATRTGEFDMHQYVLGERGVELELLKGDSYLRVEPGRNAGDEAYVVMASKGFSGVDFSHVPDLTPEATQRHADAIGTAMGELQRQTSQLAPAATRENGDREPRDASGPDSFDKRKRELTGSDRPEPDAEAEQGDGKKPGLLDSLMRIVGQAPILAQLSNSFMQGLQIGEQIAAAVTSVVKGAATTTRASVETGKQAVAAAGTKSKDAAARMMVLSAVNAERRFELGWADAIGKQAEKPVSVWPKTGRWPVPGTNREKDYTVVGFGRHFTLLENDGGIVAVRNTTLAVDRSQVVAGANFRLLLGDPVTGTCTKQGSGQSLEAVHTKQDGLYAGMGGAEREVMAANWVATQKFLNGRPGKPSMAQTLSEGRIERKFKGKPIYQNADFVVLQDGDALSVHSKRRLGLAGKDMAEKEWSVLKSYSPTAGMTLEARETPSRARQVSRRDGPEMSR